MGPDHRRVLFTPGLSLSNQKRVSRQKAYWSSSLLRESVEKEEERKRERERGIHTVRPVAASISGEGSTTQEVLSSPVLDCAVALSPMRDELLVIRIST
jgi:hypothetical protein